MMKYKPKKMTVDELVTITLNAFNQLQKDMQNGFAEVRVEIQEATQRLDEKLSRKIDELKAIVTVNHENRISILEDDVRQIKTKREK